ncbi:hypothetical protein GCM10010919_16860 [Alishewanella longhuensis]|uniref:MSHA biogenesis protein MshJ n=1 Tax=Alishewanella longhuensis TaxID=1091037 RepID=A0ABQ3KYJ6_9ALTE|nr:hypothetical protein [Alishewanella longhuensis]GHG67851.1 hypothetical protein GCM10010919_16860 [Alishewanella longhuensis]
MSAWQQVTERYTKLQLREKRLVFFGSLALMIWVSLIFLLEPAYLRWQAVKQQTLSLERVNQALSQQLTLLQQQLSQDINQPIQLDIVSKQQQQAVLLKELGAYRQQFITGSQTVKMLQDILGPLSALQLVSLRSEPAVPIRLPGESPEAPVQLFQHVTVLSVTGNYMQLKSLLEQVEVLPWLFTWQKLEYQVLEYPKAQMTLFISTVSADESYIQF